MVDWDYSTMRTPLCWPIPTESRSKSSPEPLDGGTNAHRHVRAQITADLGAFLAVELPVLESHVDSDCLDAEIGTSF